MVYKLILDFKEMSKEKKQSPLTKYIFEKSSPKTRKKKLNRKMMANKQTIAG